MSAAEQGPSAELQRAIIAALKAALPVTEHVGADIYTDAPRADIFPRITLGSSDLRPGQSDDLTDQDQTVQVDVWTRGPGSRTQCKAITDTVVAALHRGSLAIAEPHALVRCEVVLARVIDDPDPLTRHGIVQLDVAVETHGA